MKRMLLYFFALAIGLLSLFCRCGESNVDTGKYNPERPLDKQIPKVLFITTGINNQTGVLPKGIVIAIQAMNNSGAMVRLESRDVLYDQDELNKYNIVIILTTIGYHDADRRYSLSFMSEVEMENIRLFVENGGVLIAGDNVGRNLIDGSDRISLYHKLRPDNYQLSNCFGVGFEERDMKNYTLYGEIGDEISGYFRDSLDNSFWTLVPDTIISDKVEPLLFWMNHKDTIPAALRNRYGRGTAYLLPSSDFLHPANDGGVWSAMEIMEFYNFVLADFQNYNGINATLNSWPEDFKYAFCMTFNSAGTIDEYERLFKFLDKNKIDPVLFVNGLVDENIRQFIRDNKIPIQSSGYAYQNYRHMKFPTSVQDILSNEHSWKQKFTGFRFPYTQIGYWGLLALDENDYCYESSIGANNLEFFHGSVFPYNIVISNDQFYKTTELLEVGTVYHDDYYFLKDFSAKQSISPKNAENDISLYKEYLANYWDRAVKPYHGLMVYLGHPEYVGMNDSTLSSLKFLLDHVNKDHTWIASLDEIVKFRKDLAKLQFYITNSDGTITIKVVGPENVITEKASIVFKDDPGKADALTGKTKVRSDSSGYYVIFDAHNGQVITLE